MKESPYQTLREMMQRVPEYREAWADGIGRFLREKGLVEREEEGVEVGEMLLEEMFEL